MDRKLYEFGRYDITRDGQQAPSRGDLVCVQAAIYLPADGEGELRDDLRFSNRVLIDAEKLHLSWGYELGEERYRCQKFAAATWHEAELKADRWATGELDKLKAAIEARYDALRQAGA